MQSNDGITSRKHTDDTTNSNENVPDAHSPLDVNINDLTLQFETSAITTPSDHQSNPHPYAHRQTVLNSFRPPVADRTLSDTQSSRINKALAWQRTVNEYPTNLKENCGH